MLAGKYATLCLMEFVVLVVLGLSVGSFVNAVVWRIHEQSEIKSKKSGNWKMKIEKLSIAKGRSMCPHCRHQLAGKDLIPVLSWVSLGGKCRYCKKPISVQYPLVELSGALLFIASYVWWPFELAGYVDYVRFGIWLVVLTELLILFIYDLKWLILPDAVTLPLIALVIAEIVFRGIFQEGPEAVRDAIFGMLSIGGFFYALFIVSKGRWIGGGDVKLGILLGLLLGWPASLVGMAIGFYSATIVVVILMLLKKVKRSQHIPFGPFLIFGAITAMLFSEQIIDTYYKILVY